MNSNQLKSIQNITNKLNRIRPGFEFNCILCGLNNVLLTASNKVNYRWCEDSDTVVLIVGPRGGFKIKQASSFIRTMML